MNLYQDFSERIRQLYSLEAEQSVLGSVLLSPLAFDLAVEAHLLRDHFHMAQHRSVWEVVEVLRGQNKPVDVVTVSEYMEQKNTLEAAGGFDYLVSLAANTPSYRNVAMYAQVVVERFREREWFSVADQIKSLIMEQGLSHEERIGGAQSLVTALSSEEKASSLRSLKDVLRVYVDELDERFRNPGIHGVLTGYKHVDHRLQGLQGGELIVVAGRPAMGKTTYAMGIAKNAALNGIRTLIFSLEMPATKLAQRMIANQGSIPLGLLKSAKVLGHEECSSRMIGVVSTLMGLPIEIDDQGGLSINELCARARRQHRKEPVGLVVIDYIGLLAGNSRAENRSVEVGQISTGLKALSKELNCPVIALSQVNRDCEKRANKRPANADLRDSGSIEQDADVIQFVYRDEVYNENSQQKGMVEIITGKQRDGEVGTDYLAWKGQYNRMDEFEPNAQGAANDTKDEFEYAAEY